MLLAAVLLGLTALWATPAPAYACSCAAKTDAEYAQRADVIFTGTVISDQRYEPAQTVTFAVERVYKGQARSTETISTMRWGGACGPDLSEPEPYLVYVTQESVRSVRQPLRRHEGRPGSRKPRRRAGAPGRTGAAQRRAARTARLHRPVGAVGRTLPGRDCGRHRRPVPDPPDAAVTACARPAALALAGVLLALVAVWLTPASAYACSCVTDSEPELVRTAEVIFTGTVADDRSLGDTRTYTFTVDRVFRGQVLATQTVRTHTQGPACGLDLEGPGPYLVLGYLRDGVLLANSCGGTRAGAPPAELGAGYPPQPGFGADGGDVDPGQRRPDPRGRRSLHRVRGVPRPPPVRSAERLSASGPARRRPPAGGRPGRR